MRGRAKEGEEKKEKEMVKREVKLRKRDLYHRFRIRFRIRKIILQESLKILNQTSTDIFQGFYMGFSHDGSGRIHRATTRCCCCLLEMSSVVMAGGVGEVSGRRVGEVVTRHTKRGKIVRRVRERYLRDDIPCRCLSCEICIPFPGDNVWLADNRDAYIIPGLDAISDYLEVFELHEITDVIILQTMMADLSRTISGRVKKLLSNTEKRFVYYSNDNSKFTYVPQSPSESPQRCALRAICKAAQYYQEHLPSKIISVLSDDPTLSSLCSEAGVNCMTMETWATEGRKGEKEEKKEESPKGGRGRGGKKKGRGGKEKGGEEKKGELSKEGLDLFESLNLAVLMRDLVDGDKEGGRGGQSKEGEYPPHLSLEVMEASIKSRSLYSGKLQVSKSRTQEAFVTTTIGVDQVKVFIPNLLMRNRGIHGDKVVIRLLEESEWRGPANILLPTTTNPGGEIEKKGGEGGREGKEGRQDMPCGRVVGILPSQRRQIVATIPSTSDRGSSKSILAIPLDVRIPKIRIFSNDASSLKAKRIVVRIDGWDATSYYPNGHYIRQIGPVGDIDVETEAILIEHEVSFPPFSQAMLQMLPSESWTIPEKEIQKRKDLRDLLVFSVDPRGCKDVDDALSVKWLDNGLIEVGVHIADVSYFVRENTAVDKEAKYRATSVYLADRVYQMLPRILTEHFCSLRCGEDRLAVSVLFTLDPNTFEVKRTWRGRTVIHSKHELPYDLAQDILDGTLKESDRVEIEKVTPICEILKTLQTLHRLSEHLHQKRREGGAIELYSTELRFEIAERTNTNTVLPSNDGTLSILTDEEERKHKKKGKGKKDKEVVEMKVKEELAMCVVVAELMIMANRAVASFIASRDPKRAVLRIHPHPQPGSFEEIVQLAELKGFTFETETNKKVANSLDFISKVNPSFGKLLRSLATKAVSEAQYVTPSITEHLHHYGLGCDKYTHFTSPIRRYADLCVHRILLAELEKIAEKEGKKNEEGEKEREKEGENEGEEEGRKMCKHLNDQTRKAKLVQRASTDLFLRLFLHAQQQQQQQQQQQLQLQQNPLNLTNVVNSKSGKRGEKGEGRERTGEEYKATVYKLRNNGFLAYIPSLGIKGPVYLKDKDGNCDLEVKVTKQNYQRQQQRQGGRTARIVGMEHDTTFVRLCLMTERETIYLNMFDEVVVRLYVGDSEVHYPPFDFSLSGIGTREEEKKKGGEKEEKGEERGGEKKDPKLTDFIQEKKERGEGGGGGGEGEGGAFHHLFGGIGKEKKRGKKQGKEQNIYLLFEQFRDLTLEDKEEGGGIRTTEEEKNKGGDKEEKGEGGKGKWKRDWENVELVKDVEKLNSLTVLELRNQVRKWCDILPEKKRQITKTEIHKLKKDEASSLLKSFILEQ